MSELQLNDFTILSQYQQNFTTIFRYDILIKDEEAERNA